MKRAILVGTLALVGALALSAGIAVAGGGHTSKPVFDDADAEDIPGKAWVTGHVKSSTTKCRPHRKVKVFFGYTSESRYRLVDVAASSDNGQFSGLGPAEHHGNPVIVAKFKLLAKDVGSDHCSGGTINSGDTR